MKRLTFFLSIIFVHHSYALEGIITVLEAPLFDSPSKNSKILEYKRKGDLVYLHSKYQLDYQWQQNYPIKNNSPEETELPDYLLTVDSAGQDAYLKREHVYLIYEDQRELSQDQNFKDMTDYRLKEPLPKNYPFKNVQGIRGWLAFSIHQPSQNNYAYPERIKAEGYSYQYELEGSFLKNWQRFESGRVYYGINFLFKRFTNEFRLETRNTEESWTKFGLGPSFTYDILKQKDRGLSFILTPVFYYTHLSVFQQLKNSSLNEQRDYTAFSVALRTSAMYRFENIIDNVDFFTSLILEFEGAQSFKSKQTSQNTSWWNPANQDGHQSENSLSVGLQFGVQSAY